MVVCSNANGIKWKVRDRDISDEIQLCDVPGVYTNAAELLSGRNPASGPIEVQASDWFTHPRSKYYSVMEDSVRIFEGTVLTILWWKNEQQLIDLAED